MRTIANQTSPKFLLGLLNAAGGLLLMIKSSYKKGDFIEVGGKVGSILRKNFYTSEVKTIDGEILSLNHSTFFFNRLHNLSNQNIICVELKVNVNYSEDMAQAKNEINNFLMAQSGVLKSPRPKITVLKLHQNHVELKVTPWCSLNDFLELDHKLENRLTDHLRHLSFKIPQLDEQLEEKRAIA